MIDRGSLSPDQLRTANGGRLKSISPMSKSYQLTDSIEAPWRHSRSVFYFSLDTSFFFIDGTLCPPGWLQFVFRVHLVDGAQGFQTFARLQNFTGRNSE